MDIYSAIVSDGSIITNELEKVHLTSKTDSLHCVHKTDDSAHSIFQHNIDLNKFCGKLYVLVDYTFYQSYKRFAAKLEWKIYNSLKKTNFQWVEEVIHF